MLYALLLYLRCHPQQPTTVTGGKYPTGKIGWDRMMRDGVTGKTISGVDGKFLRKLSKTNGGGRTGEGRGIQT